MNTSRKIRTIILFFLALISAFVLIFISPPPTRTHQVKLDQLNQSGIPSSASLTLDGIVLLNRFFDLNLDFLPISDDILNEEVFIDYNLTIEREENPTEIKKQIVFPLTQKSKQTLKLFDFPTADILGIRLRVSVLLNVNKTVDVYARMTYGDTFSSLFTLFLRVLILILAIVFFFKLHKYSIKEVEEPVPLILNRILLGVVVLVANPISMTLFVMNQELGTIVDSVLISVWCCMCFFVVISQFASHGLVFGTRATKWVFKRFLYSLIPMAFMIQGTIGAAFSDYLLIPNFILIWSRSIIMAIMAVVTTFYIFNVKSEFKYEKEISYALIGGLTLSFILFELYRFVTGVPVDAFIMMAIGVFTLFWTFINWPIDIQSPIETPSDPVEAVLVLDDEE